MDAELHINQLKYIKEYQYRKRFIIANMKGTPIVNQAFVEDLRLVAILSELDCYHLDLILKQHKIVVKSYDKISCNSCQIPKLLTYGPVFKSDMVQITIQNYDPIKPQILQ